MQSMETIVTVPPHKNIKRKRACQIFIRYRLSDTTVFAGFLTITVFGQTGREAALRYRHYWSHIGQSFPIATISWVCKYYARARLQLLSRVNVLSLMLPTNCLEKRCDVCVSYFSTLSQVIHVFKFMSSCSHLSISKEGDCLLQMVLETLD